MANLEITIIERGQTTVLRLKGSADMEEAEHLSKELEKIVENGHLEIIVDLADLAFASSLGIGALIRSHNRCRQAGGRLTLVNPQQRVLRVLQTTRLDELFGICSSVEEAIGQA